jgi:putative membrane protein
MTANDGEGHSVPDASTMLAVERTLLAHERTLLAWIRTAISLISFGFTIQQFFRVARATEPPDGRFLGPQEFGLLMMITGLLALVLAVLQHRFDIRALQSRYPPEAGYPSILSRARYMAALIAILGIIGLMSMALRP